ncbi:MAG: hypothetical protein HZB53_19970 [Chloroflexi bacterium]|nr:hypothetical protein [Chloroflexota bacterium]
MNLPVDILNMLYAIGAAIILVAVRRRLPAAGSRWFYIGFGVLLLGYVSCVAEDLLWATEHSVIKFACIATAGICFLAGVRELGEDRA